MLIPSLLMMASTAGAADVTLWEEGQPRRLAVSMHTLSPVVVVLMAVQNEERFAATVGVDLILRCRHNDERGRSVEVLCQVEDAGFSATPLQQHSGQLGGILADYETIAERSTVYFWVKRNGRVARVRVEDPQDDTERARFILGRIEKMVACGLSPLDLPRPDPDEEAWKHRTPLLGVPVFTTSLSSLSVDLQNSTDPDSPYQIIGTGQGVMDGISNAGFEIRAATRHQLHPETGRILDGIAQVDGSSTTALNPLRYTMTARVQDIANAQVPPLGNRDLSLRQ